MATSYIGRYNPRTGQFILEDGTGYQNIFRVIIPGYPSEKMQPIAGDFNGDGLDEVGLFAPEQSVFFLANSNTPDPTCRAIQFGPPGQKWIGVAGDWTGQGKDTIGLYSPQTGRWFLRNSNTPGPAEIPDANGFQYGPANQGWIPLVGRWNGGTKDTIGAYSPSAGRFFLRNSNSAGAADYEFSFGAGNIGQIPITGDFLNTGKSTVAVLHPYHESQNSYHCFFQRFTNNPADTSSRIVNVSLRSNDWIPIAGRWSPGVNPLPVGNTTPLEPPWTTSAVIYQMRVDLFSPDGKFTGTRTKLAYLANLGVTCLMLNPIAKMNRTASNPLLNVYYDVLEPAQLDPQLGTEQDFKDFVSDAHALGLKVIVDVVPHGINPLGSVFKQHPDWFIKDHNGSYLMEWGTTYELDYTIPEVQSYWVNTMVNDWALKYNLDGFRCDLEPQITGDVIWPKVRTQAQQAGKSLIIISEERSLPRNMAYHVSQEDSGLNTPKGGPDFFNGGNLETFCKSSVDTYLSSALSSHDRDHYGVKGSIVRAAYGCILAPVVPVWFMGEEFNAPERQPAQPPALGSALYFNKLDWNVMDNIFLGRFKQLLQIRKLYQSVIAPFPRSANQTYCVNLPTVNASLPAYAMSDTRRAIIVFGRRESVPGVITAQTSPALLKLVEVLTYSVVNLINGDSTTISKEQLKALQANVAANDVAVYKVEPVVV